ncbi:filamentous hemagglutinin N-terminal domain-containing protein [Trichocoleus sp. ST-U3]
MKGCHLEKWLIPGSVLYALLSSNLSIAQVVGDTTLPVGERSLVTGNPNFQIDGGATRGGNLFHSFSEFSVPTGGSAFFNNAVDVQNILTRVTGGSISNIDGLIQANGTANLFLLNPNGILFGADAQLNIGGSFVATTADAIWFPNGEFFSSNAAQAVPSQLLTVNPNALFFNQQNPQPIINQSTFNNTGLQVPLRQNLLLVGGVVQLDNGWLISPGSYVEIGSIGGVGTVGLSTTGEDWQLNIPNRVTRADVSLRNGSDINVKGDGGSIRILGQNINISDTSLRIEIPSSGLPDTKTGDMELNATGSIAISNSLLANSLFGQGTIGGINLSAGDRISLDGSAVFNALELTGVGKVGDINMTTGSLSLTGGTYLDSYTAGLGNAGSVNINARDTVSFDDTIVATTLDPTGVGNTGDINLTTGSLSLTGGAQLTTIARGRGNTGSVNINARDTVTISFYGSGVNNSLEQTGVGNGGDINITAGSLSVTEDAFLNSNTAGLGNAGSVNINARDTVSFDSSRLYNNVEPTGVGNGGDINITTGSLSLTGGAFLFSTTRGLGNAGSVNINARDTVSLDDSSYVLNTVERIGVGNAGNITLTTGSLSVTNGSLLDALTKGQGSAGNVNIMVRDAASFDGVDSDGTPSGVLTGVVEDAVGEGGDLSITAGSLRLANGATLSGLTLGQGSAGNINITVRDAILLEGIARGGTGIFTTVGQTGEGNGGTINLRAGSLSIIGDGAIAADTNGQGQGGNINLDVQGTLRLSGGRTAPTGESSRITLGVQPEGTASGGDLRIRAGSLVLQDGGLVKASTQGQADAGNIDITADVVDISGSVPTSGLPSGLFTSSDTAGNAGNITINTQTFRIADGAALSARSQGDGQGGDITVNAARTFEALNGGQLITTTFGRAQAGSITINAAEQLTIAGSDPNYAARLAKFPNPVDLLVANAISETGAASGLFANTEPNSAGGGGDIQIATGQLTVQEGGQLITSTSGSGQAGDITVNASDIQLSGAASGLFAGTTSEADAGNLTIQPQGDGQSVRVNLQDGAQISASTSSSGNGGQLTITAPQSITLTGNGSVIAAETDGSGTGGNLNLQTGTLNIQNQAQVTVSSSGTGSAGSLFIDANQIYLDNSGRIRADTSGGGGNINLRSPLILLRNGSSITTNATGSNIPGGNINIDTDNLVAVPSENSDISANSDDFRGGNVTIRASGIFGIEFRERVTPLSDITATGVSEGTVNLITPGIDPSRGLAELPTDVVDVSNAIAQGCRDVQGSSFVATGRGGLPPTPQQALGDDPRWRDWRTPAVVSRQPNTHDYETLPPSANPASTKSALVEATGWVIEPDGKVILTASAPNVTSPNRRGQPVNCDGS